MPDLPSINLFCKAFWFPFQFVLPHDTHAEVFAFVAPKPRVEGTHVKSPFACTGIRNLLFQLGLPSLCGLPVLMWKVQPAIYMGQLVSDYRNHMLVWRPLNYGTIEQD